ncbi:carbohydrate ABC transporter permease [Lapidilactobacillus luobeiensis]|uniref:carbohydrate ABC transporter permease n=1 Tax=Lapidilactobacillus luobeiensis TaxID=2950371 RepID=UPI0021C4320E|nr:carbohydrate ABC transporter permease [Lapidilactobacillus luobeiensis]
MAHALRTKRTLIYVFCGILTLLSILPFWILLCNATRSVEQIRQGLSLIPSDSLVHNWHVLMNQGFNVWQGMGNSFFIAACSTILSVYFSAMGAYAFTAYNFKGKKILFGMMIGLIMIPPQISMIGFYQFMMRLNLLNNYIPLILPAIAAPNTVFFLVEYMETVYQPDYADAARLEGASEITIFHKIMLPIMKPGLATMGIFAFVASWNNFLMPLILINDQAKYTLPMLVQLLTANIYRTEFGAMYLGIGLTVIPLIIIYLLLSRYIIGGVTAGGLKE